MCNDLPNHYRNGLMYYPIHPSIDYTHKYYVNIYPYCVWVKNYSILTFTGKYLPTHNMFTQYLGVLVNIAWISTHIQNG